MPPSAPFSSGCEWQNVCAKYCCEHWVLSHSAHTANRCYSEKNKTQTYSKREHFSSSPYHEPQAPARRPVARNNSTPHHMGRGLAGHRRNARLGTGDKKLGCTLQFAWRAPQFGDMVSTSVQRSKAHVLRAEVMSLLAKETVETVYTAQSELGLYSRYFLVPK